MPLLTELVDLWRPRATDMALLTELASPVSALSNSTENRGEPFFVDAGVGPSGVEAEFVAAIVQLLAQVRAESSFVAFPCRRRVISMVVQVMLPSPRLPWPNRSQLGESVARVHASGLCVRPLATAIVSATHLRASALRRWPLVL